MADQERQQETPETGRLALLRASGAPLGFGVAFITFGALGLLRAGGVHVPVTWLYAAVLLGLGGAGMLSARERAR